MKIKKLGKKGIFFSLIAILLAGLTISSFLVYNKYKYSDQMDIIGIRITTMNDFLNSVENDLNRALYIASFRTMISMNDYIINVNKSGGKLLDNVSQTFEQLMKDGTIGNNIEVELLMEDQTMTDWIKKIENISLQIGIVTEINMTSIEICHTSPWKVGITANFTLVMDDDKDIAHWEKNISSETEIEIIGFQDPLYANRTGEYRKIERTAIAGWNISNLTVFYESGKYITDVSAPNFLMRMEGNLTNDPDNFGIITLVDDDHKSNDIDIYNRSSVDFRYWGEQVNNNQKITGLTDGDYFKFRLDPGHIESFNVADLNYTHD
jgi:archaellum component FlaF (FlaF/FlaG flagellin family)